MKKLKLRIEKLLDSLAQRIVDWFMILFADDDYYWIEETSKVTVVAANNEKLKVHNKIFIEKLRHINFHKTFLKTDKFNAYLKKKFHRVNKLFVYSLNSKVVYLKLGLTQLFYSLTNPQLE